MEFVAWRRTSGLSKAPFANAAPHQAPAVEEAEVSGVPTLHTARLTGPSLPGAGICLSQAPCTAGTVIVAPPGMLYPMTPLASGYWLVDCTAMATLVSVIFQVAVLLTRQGSSKAEARKALAGPAGCIATSMWPEAARTSPHLVPQCPREDRSHCPCGPSSTLSQSRRVALLCTSAGPRCSWPLAHPGPRLCQGSGLT